MKNENPKDVVNDIADFDNLKDVVSGTADLLVSFAETLRRRADNGDEFQDIQDIANRLRSHAHDLEFVASEWKRLP